MDASIWKPHEPHEPVDAAGSITPQYLAEAMAQASSQAILPDTPDTPQSNPPPTRSDQIQARAESLGTSALLAAAGGYLDGFTYVGHGHIFANAMTGNVVLLGIGAISPGTHQSFRHLPPIVMFLLGIWAAKALHTDRGRRIIRNPFVAVLFFELSIILLLAWLPQHTRDFWITCSIAFAASMQVQTFRSVAGFTYNSTFMTGNLRTLSVGLFDWFFAHREKDGRTAARVFTSICIAFLLGATAGGFAVGKLGNRALLLELVLLLAVLVRMLTAWTRKAPSL